MENPLLARIEALFSQGNVKDDADALALVQQLALPVLLRWEQESQTIRDGLNRTKYWEAAFSASYPVTYERLRRSAGRRSNAAAFVGQMGTQKKSETLNIWRSLIVSLSSGESDRGVWQAPGRSAVNVADEFGVDTMLFLVLRPTRIHVQSNRRRGNNATIDLWSEAFGPLVPHTPPVMRPTRLWSVPFQDAALVLMENVNTHHQELVWISVVMGPPRQRLPDLSNWAVNHNNLAENPEDFAAPAFLLGDPTLVSMPIVASTEGRTDIPTAKTAVAAVTIRKRDTMLFDQVKQVKAPTDAKHWRHLVTDELWEAKGVPVSAACFVLDSFLLYASHDGILRAHPRGNPNSVYHVEEMRSFVPHLVSLYNVVAIVHSHDTLEVRRVERQDDDPFLRFTLLYRTTGTIDAAHAPLLYGPYVLFAAVDGSWYRVQYDRPQSAAAADHYKELVKVPFNKVGWRLVAITNANWRYWTLVMQRTPKSDTEEFLLLLSGQKEHLVASCIECGTIASHLCGACESVGYCSEHGEHVERHKCRREDNTTSS